LIRQIELDASGWKQPSDFYDALLPELGAPRWHGRNLDALDDSIFTGGINSVEPPFAISVTGTDSLSQPMKVFLEKVRAVFTDNAGKADATITFSPSL
jgi:RNAse (barnase) inhibitor barstar